MPGEFSEIDQFGGTKDFAACGRNSSGTFAHHTSYPAGAVPSAGELELSLTRQKSPDSCDLSGQFADLEVEKQPPGQDMKLTPSLFASLN